jgi:hypothetical protein
MKFQLSAIVEKGQVIYKWKGPKGRSCISIEGRDTSTMGVLPFSLVFQHKLFLSSLGYKHSYLYKNTFVIFTNSGKGK